MGGWRPVSSVPSLFFWQRAQCWQHFPVRLGSGRKPSKQTVLFLLESGEVERRGVWDGGQFKPSSFISLEVHSRTQGQMWTGLLSVVITSFYNIWACVGKHNSIYPLPPNVPLGIRIPQYGNRCPQKERKKKKKHCNQYLFCKSHWQIYLCQVSESAHQLRCWFIKGTNCKN